MFLEPVYLNEAMLMNCASYIFKGVTFEAETITNSEDIKKVHGTANAGIEMGFDLFNNIAKGAGDLDFQGESSKLNNLQTKLIRNVTLGSWHMRVIEAMSDENILELTSDTLRKPIDHSYIKVKAVLKPVEFYSMLEIMKLILSQSESFIDSAGKEFFKAEKGKNQNLKVLNDKIERYVNITKSLSGLINELENDYLKSNLLEMMMVDDKGVIGVLDIDVKDKSANEIKSQLTDGEFIIFGKVVRYINSEEELNLIQRSSLSIIIDKLGKLISIVDKIQDDNPDFLNSYSQISSLVKTVAEQLIDLKIKGPLIRLKAMSVCM